MILAFFEDMMLSNLLEKTSYFLIITLFILSQLISISAINKKLFLIGSKVLIIDKNVFQGSIFFSGELPGKFFDNYSDAVDTFTKLNVMFNNIENYLYFVNGLLASPESNKQTMNLILNSLRNLNVSAINPTEFDLYNIYPIESSERELFVSANQNNDLVPSFKIISLAVNNLINQNKFIPIFVTGVSSRFSLYKNNELESFHNYVEETATKIVNSLNKLNDIAKAVKFKILLFDSDYLLLKRIFDQVLIKFDIIVCSNSYTSDKIIKKGDSFIIFSDRIDKKIIRLDIYSRNQKKYFRITELPIFRKFSSLNSPTLEFHRMKND